MTAAARLIGAASACWVLGACGAPAPRAGFDDVQRLARERGVQRIHWYGDSAEDEAVSASLQDLLGRELTADDAVQIALLNNRALRAAYEELGLAQADLVRAGLLRNPVLDAELRFATPGGTGVELGLAQSFLDVLFIPLRKRVAGAQFEAAKHRVAGAVLDLAAETRAALYRLQAAMQTEEMRRTVVAATGASFELARRLREAGNIAALDLASERALHEESVLDLAAAEAEVIALRERLTALMGLWGAQADWTTGARLPDPPADEGPLERLESRAVAASLDLRAAKREIEAEAVRLGVARPLGVADESALGVAAEREIEGTWSVGPAVTVPVPLFDQGQAAALTAQSRLRRSRERFTALAVQVRSEARAAGAALMAARARADYYREVVLPLRAQIVDETQKQYNAMQVGGFQLLDAKRRQIDAGARSIEAVRDYWLARVRLDSVLAGRLRDPAAGLLGEGTARAGVMAGPDAAGAHR